MQAGWTSLHSASEYGYLDLARLLIDRGADVNLRRADRLSSLHLSLSSGHLDVTRLLIQHGANVDSRNDNGETLWTWHRNLGT